MTGEGSLMKMGEGRGKPMAGVSFQTEPSPQSLLECFVTAKDAGDPGG